MTQRLIDGIKHFQQSIYPDRKAHFEILAEGQQPHTALITCSDSRVDPYLLTSSNPGDLFVIQSAGNIVPPNGSPPSGETATIEYAVQVLKVQNIVVCGHARCGAMDALTQPEMVTDLPAVRAWIDQSNSVRAEISHAGPFASDAARIEAAVKGNIVLQLEHLRSYPYIEQAEAGGELVLAGWYYDFVTGQVESYDAVTGEFVAV